jgi:tetratricopeptide (TPR) repeat protein
LESKWIRLITAPFRYLAGIPAFLALIVGTGIEAASERLARSKWLRWLYLVMWTGRMAAATLFAFVSKWFYSRNYWKLLGGGPAIALCLPVAFFLVRVPFQTAEAKAMRYRMAAAEAWKNEDFDSMRLYHRKIQQLGVQVEKALFDSAVTLAAEGKHYEAYQQMKRLADESNLVPAKLWVADALLGGRVPLPDQAASKLAAAYIDQILATEPDNVGARLLKAEIYRTQGEASRAIQLLAPLSRQYISAYTRIAQIERARGDFLAAESAIEMVLKHFQRRFDQGVNLSATEYRDWSQANMMNRDYAKMEEVANQGLAHYPDNGQLRHSIVELYKLVFDGLTASSGDAELRFRLIKTAHRLEPDDASLLDRLAALVGDPSLPREALERVTGELEKESNLPASVHAALGTVAFRQRDFATARRHFEAAAQKRPDAASVTNNLAWLLSNTEPLDLEKALALASQAVELAPDVATYRETRGQILLKLGRWSDSVVDLQAALNGMPDDSTIHESLATAYEKLGNTDLARAHRRSLASISTDHDRLP